jgi:hypothetical protein
MGKRPRGPFKTMIVSAVLDTEMGYRPGRLIV